MSEIGEKMSEIGEEFSGKKILVAMSGGVDSSFTALKLARAGADVAGIYMRLHDRAGGYHEQNIANAKKICEHLGAPFFELDLREDFKRAVYEPFINAYAAGRTPNPCAMCNRFIKLGALADFAAAQNRLLATGHYARKVLVNGRWRVKMALDSSKDQSYFLAASEPAALERVIFPLGESIKAQLKAEAMREEVIAAIAQQKESSEICFVERDYTDVLAQHLPPAQPGIVRDEAGREIGSHSGYMHYTVGKRRGFTVNGAHEPHFVLRVLPESNEIIVGPKSALAVSEFALENLNDFAGLSGIVCASVKTRYRSAAVPCELDVAAKRVRLKSEILGIASAQLAVFYENDEVIASGFIR